MRPDIKIYILNLIETHGVSEKRETQSNGYTTLEYKLDGTSNTFWRNSNDNIKIVINGIYRKSFNPKSKNARAADKIDLIDIFTAVQNKFYAQSIRKQNSHTL